MFIRKTKKTDLATSKIYYSYQLVEAIRTEKGPRQNILLTISNASDLSDDERKMLSNRIEEIVHGVISLFAYPIHIESLAQCFAKQLIQKQSLPCADFNNSKDFDYHNVNINSLQNDNARNIGLEHICLETFRKLEIDLVLKRLGFTKRQIEIVAGVIIGRLAGNVSELATFEWLQNVSGLDELLQTSFSQLSLNTLYKIGDSLRKIKEPLENHLRNREANLFSFANTVALYDLTNIYYEGSAEGNNKAKKGRSKDKRNDCPLITLGVVYNLQGFPLSSDIFEGNVSEPKTLETVLKRMPINSNTIVVLDGGLGTEDNLLWLRSQGIRYIVRSRKRQLVIPDGLTMQCVKEKSGQNVYAAKVKAEGIEEILIYCKSEAKRISEEKWKGQVQKNFEKALQKIADSLQKKGSRNGYRTILERIGRLKERYGRIAQFYSINIQTDEQNKKIHSISWECNHEKVAERFDGGYCLRVFGLDWDCQQLWETYVMLTKAEEGFRCLKGQLGLRPVYHQKETRSDSHLFITLIAYHIMQSVLYQLEQKGIFVRWEKLRRNMNTHLRITTSFQTKNEKKIHIRSTSNPEIFHSQIYSALGINSKPIKKIKTII